MSGKTQDQIVDHLYDSLLPCPFCGSGETRIEKDEYWTGKRSTVIGARVKHWCTRREGYPQSFLQIAGKDAASAVDLWNERMG